MDFWDSLKKTASQVANTVSETATAAGQKVAETATAAGQKVAETATAAGQKVAETATTATGAVSSFFQSASDSVANFTSMKVKEMLRGINLQASIDALNKHQKEKGTDVTALVNFIKRLKDFSEDGK